MMEKKRIVCWALVIAAGLLLLHTSNLQEAAPYPAHDEAASSASWTLLIYMSNDVPGSPLNWSADINEMERGLINEELTAIALVDPENLGDSMAFRITRDANASDEIVSEKITDLPFLPGSGEADMGDPDTLVDFAQFVIEGYHEGGRFGIIFWGHGNSWYGVCQDRGDYLDPPEMTDALIEIEEMLGSWIDLVVFDSCSMGSTEVLSNLSGIVNYSVSSEIPIPSYGFPYDAVFSRISIDLSGEGDAIGRAFADEYVKFGALIAEVTSQAAVIDLGRLGETTGDLQMLARECELFVPIAKENLMNARNGSLDVEFGASVDLIEYLKLVVCDEIIPKRVRTLAELCHEEISDAVTFDRLFIAPSDSDSFSIESLNGLSLYYPKYAVPLSDYENTGVLADAWGSFLDALYSADTDDIPDANQSLDLVDGRFDDGLVDVILLTWNSTSEIYEWEVDIHPNGSLEPLFSETAIDSARELVIDYLEPGIYDLCMYGRSPDDEYVQYTAFDGVMILRQYSFTVILPVDRDLSGAQLKLWNLRTGDQASLTVSSHSIVLSFVIPEPYIENDIVLIELHMDNAVLARGVIIVSGATWEVSLTPIPEPPSLVIFTFSMVLAVLLAVAFIRTSRSRLDRLEEIAETYRENASPSTKTPRASSSESPAARRDERRR